MRYALNNLSFISGLVTSYSLRRNFFVFATLCVMIVGESSHPLKTHAQTRFRGPDIPNMGTSKSDDNRPTLPRAATLQGELIPLDPTRTDERFEANIPPLKNFSTKQLGDIRPRESNARFGQFDDFHTRASFGRNRSQDSRANDGLDSLRSYSGSGTDPSENIITQRYADGKPRVIRQVAQDATGNYYNHGPWEFRDPAGQTVAEGTYVRGSMDGQWSRKHESNSSGLFATKPFNLFNGPFHSVAHFKNGKLNGLWTIYDKHNTKIFDISYEQGIREGTATWFYPNNTKMREATFRRGLIDGEIIDFDETGKVTKRRQFVDGRPIVRNTTFYRPNVKKTEEYFLGKKLEPEDADDWWEAKPTPFLETGTATQNGAAMSWYENGQPKTRGQFIDGQPVGQFTWWHANGNKQSEGFYIEGQKNRRWTWWHDSGMKQVEGVFKDDQPIQIWRAWHADGKLEKEKNYSEVTEPLAIASPQESQTTETQIEAGNDPNDEDPNPVTQQRVEQTGDPLPLENLPPPRSAKPVEGQPEDMESITPLEIKAPITNDSPAENMTDPEEEVGSISAIPIEGPSDPPNKGSPTKSPKNEDKSA